MYNRGMDKWYNLAISWFKKLKKKRDTSQYSFEYNEDGKPIMSKKYYGTKDV